MDRFTFINSLLHAMVILVGAGIGSFLNVVIYRVPLGMSVNHPRRSFCPPCGRQIPWYENIPLLSWLLLRGKCSACGAGISVRYFLVELLVAVLFYVTFLCFGGAWPALSQWGPQVLALWVFLALLVAGTFIDIEHFILPHSITFGGLGVGLVFATWVPQIVGQETHAQGLLVSFLSAFFGMGLLWTVVVLGKLAFGRLNVKFDQPTAWTIAEEHAEEPPTFRVGEEARAWEELFGSGTERLVITCASLRINERTWENVRAEVRMETVRVLDAAKDREAESFALEGITKLEGTTTAVTIPRDAMGMGDVFFIAMIGSFIGWQGVLASIFGGSILGSIISGVPRLLRLEKWSRIIPFGPFLAGGAALWVFYGPQFVDWYVRTVLHRDY